MMKLYRICGLAVAAWIALMPMARADEPSITVTAMGESNIKPDRLEINIKAAASAELTSDALVKYREALRRAKDAFDKLKIEKLEIVDDGLNITSGIMGAGQVNFAGGGNQPAGKSEVGISESLRLSVKDIDKLSDEEVTTLISKLLDTAKDVGVAAGPEINNSMMMRMTGMAATNPLATFVVDDPSAARKKASEEAFRRAKEKAQGLAQLAGSQLGPALAVEEIPSSTGTKQESIQERMIEMIYGGGSAAPDDPRLTSNSLREIPVRVNLRVRFGLQSSGASK